jgi:hypothetical protein
VELPDLRGAGGVQPLPAAGRPPSVFLAGMPEPTWQDEQLAAKWDRLLAVRAAVTKTHLILQARCAEPLLDKLRLAVTENSPQLLSDDCLEFFLDVRASGKDYQKDN